MIDAVAAEGILRPHREEEDERIGIEITNVTDHQATTVQAEVSAGVGAGAATDTPAKIDDDGLPRHRTRRS